MTRFAALLHDIGKPRTRRFTKDGTVTFHHHDVVGAKMARKRMKALRFSNDVTDDVSRLVELHLRFHGYGIGEWTDSAVRRYVRDAGDLLDRLHVLTGPTARPATSGRPNDCAGPMTTSRRGSPAWPRTRNSPRCDPTSTAGRSWRRWASSPAPLSGKAYQFLLERRIDDGPLGEERAREELLAWWATRSV